MKGPLRFRTMPLRFLVDLGISTDFLRVEFLMLQKLFALFFGNPRSWNFSYRAQPQHHRVPWFSWNFLVPKALSKKGTPRHSPQNFFTTLFPKVAIGDYAASHFGTMSMEAFRCLKIENLWVSRVLLRTRHRMRMQIPGWSCRRPWKLRLRPGPGKPHLSLCWFDLWRYKWRCMWVAALRPKSWMRSPHVFPGGVALGEERTSHFSAEVLQIGHNFWRVASLLDTKYIL